MTQCLTHEFELTIIIIHSSDVRRFRDPRASGGKFILVRYKYKIRNILLLI